MIDIKQTCVKGTVIRFGNSRRQLMNRIIEILLVNGYNELSIPIIQEQEMFKDKVGEENNNLMYNFKDRGDRELCLAPEYTAIIQKLSQETFKHQKNVKVFYIQECFRGEKPQEGRWRQFTQIGVEIINPSETIIKPDESGEIRPIRHLEELATLLVRLVTKNIYLSLNIKRGLDYYTDGKGFEICASELGAQNQLVGGGAYEGGVGFALGFDRLMLLKERMKNDNTTTE